MTTTNSPEAQLQGVELLPCPNPACRSTKVRSGSDLYPFHIYCSDCFMKGPREGADNLGQRWNGLLRADLPAPQTDVEAVLRTAREICANVRWGDGSMEEILNETAAIILRNTARADLSRATADAARKLTLPELNHLSALLEAEKRSGEYAGPREQYYARTERLIKWCQEQINE